MLTIDSFADIVDAMLNPGKDQSSDWHLLPVCYVSAKEFEAFCGIKRNPQSNDYPELEDAAEGKGMYIFIMEE